ncbi:TASP1-like protein [Mya arenaria]|uniref:TASP1-like protein n=1 Tax=Mya arenaria TaxID=6604 RepID=A0ABY7FGG2_MYAAR|nr:TASP1-like protein [Mya arenaria]
MENRAFIAVHAGAGYHSREKENSYRKLCSQTCTKDSPLTNAGRGSSLTLEGTVECDASVMDGKSLVYGAVGAISGVQNPVLVARKLVEEQSTGNMDNENGYKESLTEGKVEAVQAHDGHLL